MEISIKYIGVVRMKPLNYRPTRLNIEEWEQYFNGNYENYKHGKILCFFCSTINQKLCDSRDEGTEVEDHQEVMQKVDVEDVHAGITL